LRFNYVKSRLNCEIYVPRNLQLTVATVFTMCGDYANSFSWEWKTEREVDRVFSILCARFVASLIGKRMRLHWRSGV